MPFPINRVSQLGKKNIMQIKFVEKPYLALSNIGKNYFTAAFMKNPSYP